MQSFTNYYMPNPTVNTTQIKSTTLQHPRNTSIQPHPSHNPLKLPQPLTFIVIMSLNFYFYQTTHHSYKNKISSCFFFYLIYLLVSYFLSVLLPAVLQFTC